jgi:hypothetical protein
LILPDLLLCGAILSSAGGVKRRSTRGSSRSKASASHRLLYLYRRAMMGTPTRNHRPFSTQIM